VALVANGLHREGDVAARLNVDVRTVQAWRQRGVGPRFLKIGSAVRYRERDLEAYLEASARASTRSGPIPETHRLRVAAPPAAPVKGAKRAGRAGGSNERAGG
jgi:hypothetical protein